MKINLSPQRWDETLTVVKNGNKLTVNGEVFDFTSMEDGDFLPGSAIDSSWFAGPVVNVGGELELTLHLPLGPEPTVDQSYPSPLLNVPDGEVILP